MKTYTSVMLALALVVYSSSSFAGDSVIDCQAVTSSWNTHADLSCPQVSNICTDLNDANSELTLVSSDRTQTILKLDGQFRQNQSDIAQQILNSYTLNKLFAHLYLNSDESYPHATATGGYRSLSIFTGARSDSGGVYPSQICTYELAP